MCIEPYITASPHKPNADLMKKLDEREHVCVCALDETHVRFYYRLFFAATAAHCFNYAKLTMSCGDCNKNEITF